MRVRSIHGLGVGLGFALLVAGGVNPASGQQVPGAANFRQAFLRLDANGDTMLEEGEVPESGREAFQRLLKRGDTNKDGKLGAEELRGLSEKLKVLRNPAGPAQRLKQMDKDGDGRIGRDEFSGPEQAFVRMDADKDGSLSREELSRPPDRPATASTPPEPEPEQPDKPGPKPPANEPDPGASQTRQAAALRRILALDSDKDGKVSRDEFKGRAEVFERLDINKDGVLDRADRPAGTPERPGAPGDMAARLRRLKTMDADGDGKVSRPEFKGPPALFDRLDRDKDGFLTDGDGPPEKASGTKPE